MNVPVDLVLLCSALHGPWMTTKWTSLISMPCTHPNPCGYTGVRRGYCAFARFNHEADDVVKA